MKFTENEWAIVNDKTGEIYRSDVGNRAVMTFFTREDARDEKASLQYSIGRKAAHEYRVERVKVTYERIS